MFRLDRKVTFWRVGGNHTVCLQVMIMIMIMLIAYGDDYDGHDCNDDNSWDYCEQNHG